MDKSQVIKEIFEKKRKCLSKALKAAREARDTAPGAMESHSDTTRSQNEKLLAALEARLKNLEDLDQKITTGSFQPRFFEVLFNGENKKLVIVPEGLGGEEVNGMRLLSETSPLGIVLKEKKLGDKFEFNGQTIEILKVE